MTQRLQRLALLVMLMVPASSFAAPVGFYDIKPVVLIILDTSGSMSYVAKELTTPACTLSDKKVAGQTYPYSRDMIAKEVLTGTFNDFWCRQRLRPAGRYDAGYPIPWFTPEYSSQTQDGIIDSHKERIKFGLMTFDSIMSAGVDASGGWSTGLNAASHANVGLINLGVQNESAPYGRLYVPASADDFPAIQAGNAIVQEHILKAIPFGGTPISPALSDAFFLLKKHKHLIKKTTTNDGDPYANCRARDVLLITDGRPTLGEGNYNYKSSVKSAESLFKSGHKVFVVGFNLATGVSSIVNEIAEAGGTTAAHIASTAAQLSAALSNILGKATPGIHSRTRTVATNITYSSTDLQYQLNTGYSSAFKSDIDIAGYGEVTAYRCTKECKDVDRGRSGPPPSCQRRG